MKSSNKKIIQKNLVIIGDSTVGKTCILNRLTGKEFIEKPLTTLGFDNVTKKIEKEDAIYSFKIWDSAGQERFASLGTKYFRSSNGIILVFDFTLRRSFDNIAKWIKLTEENRGGDLKYVLLGNKADIEEKEVTVEEGEEMAKSRGIKFFEVSAKTNLNIQESFNHIFEEIISVPVESGSGVELVSSSNEKNNKKRKC